MEDTEFTNLMQVDAPEGSDHEESEASDSDLEGVPPPTTLSHVRDNVTSLRFAQYLQQFDLEATKESVVFASLPVASIDDSHRAQTLAMGIEKEDEEMQHQNDLDHIDTLKRRRLTEIDGRRRAEVMIQQRRLNDLKVKKSLTSELVGTYYSHTSRELDIHLTARQAEVLQTVGEIRKFDRGDYDPDKPDWTRFEQQVELRVVSVRGLKNKVPRGEYVMLISKWDKMGGSPMRWSLRTADSKPPPPCPLHSDVKNMSIRRACEVCRGWAGATMPSTHQGDQKDYELKFDNRIFTFFPSERSIKPYMSLIFELVLLPKRRQGQPKVVGWSALPCVDSRFQVINGKFRFPLVRGAYSQDFGHHGEIMKFMYDDLENWLGNAYIDIFPHPREHYGRGEFALQAEFTNNLLRLNPYPSAKEGDGWPTDGRKRGSSMDATAGQDKTAPDVPKEAAFDFEDDSEEFPYERPEYIDYEETPAKTFWGIIRKAVLDRARLNARQAAETQRQAVKRAEEQKTFRFSIHPHGAINLESIWRTQVEYCVRGIMDELSLRHPTEVKFWFNIFAMFVALYLQVILHGAVLYTSLYFIGVPVQAAWPDYGGVKILYSHQNTTALQEFFFVFWAELASYILMSFFIFIGWVIRGGSGLIPDHLSKFVFTFGLTGIFVPWYQLFLDLGEGTGYGDIMRMHNWFTVHEYGSFYGYLVFILVYIFVCIATFVTVFLYTMRLHLNGILQDTYWRIMIVNEDTYTIPEDLEISLKELKHILSSAERWRGMNGERRKVSVQKIITADCDDPEYERVDMSIKVKTLQCNTAADWISEHGSRAFRSFYVMHTGAILEVLHKDIPQGLAFALNALEASRKKTEHYTEMPELGGAANLQSEAFF